jgi:phage terminase Nu1 subunit (DNA packaging protein)
MLSVAEIARRDGVKKSGVSRRIKQLRDAGLHVELDAQGRVAKVNSVQYDELRGRYGDPSKAQAPRAAIELPVPENESYEEARRQLTWIDAERAKLKLEAEQGLYVKVEDLEGALLAIGEEIVGTVDRLTQTCDDLAAAVARDGVHGLRAALKKLAFEMKTDIADALSKIAAGETS